MSTDTLAAAARSSLARRAVDAEFLTDALLRWRIELRFPGGWREFERAEYGAA